MEKKALGISWLNGEVKARAFSRGVVTGQWVSPVSYDENSDLTELFRNAAEGTKYDGKHVFMVMAHRRLAHQLIETPPVRGLDLELFVERRAAQLKTFDDECVTSFHEALPTKAANGIILHLFPKAFLTRLAHAAQQAGLQLIRLYPTVPILSEQLKQLPIQPAEATLLAAETEGITTLVIGHKDGSLALARSLNTSWRNDPERLLAELNRSMLFVKQQSAINVTSIWLFGDGAVETANAFAGRTEVPIQASTAPLSPGFWIEQAAPLPPRVPDNLLSRDFQRGAQRRLIFKVTTALTVLFFLICAATALVIEALLHRENRTLHGFKAREPALLAERQSLQDKLADFNVKLQLAQSVATNREPPIPLVFAAYLAQTVSPQVILTHVEVRGHNPGWTVLIKGRNSEATPSFNPLQNFERQLTEGPFRLTITNSSRTAQLRGDRERRHPDTAIGAFYIEGALR